MSESATRARRVRIISLLLFQNRYYNLICNPYCNINNSSQSSNQILRDCPDKFFPGKFPAVLDVSKYRNKWGQGKSIIERTTRMIFASRTESGQIVWIEQNSNESYDRWTKLHQSDSNECYTGNWAEEYEYDSDEGWSDYDSNEENNSFNERIER